MAATPVLLLLTLSFVDSTPQRPSTFRITMVSSFTLSLALTFCVLIFTLYTILKNYSYSNGAPIEETSVKIQSFPVNDDEKISLKETGCEPDSENLACSLLLEILPPTSPKWDSLSNKSEEFEDDPGEIIGPGQEIKKRKKKRVRKKKPDPNENEEESKEREGEGEEFVCLYPFTKSSSATQRKIKQEYDKLVRSHGSKGLTLDQIGQFVNCLVDARHELQSKSEVIKRRFTITRALLFKADRSSFDRLRQQIYKLELEQKRLEEDALVYNWLQEQLKASPAYKKMLEIGASMEMKEKSDSPVESADAEFSDISFEELLAQEKKDNFWQKNGKLKPCTR